MGTPWARGPLAMGAGGLGDPSAHEAPSSSRITKCRRGCFHNINVGGVKARSTKINSLCF